MYRLCNRRPLTSKMVGIAEADGQGLAWHLRERWRLHKQAFPDADLALGLLPKKVDGALPKKSWLSLKSSICSKVR